MQTLTRKLVLMLLSGCMAACAASDNFAPVSDVSRYEPIPKSGAYRVSVNDTLYSIAWRHGLDYRELADKNGIAPPYAIQSGQIIYFQGRHVQPAQHVAPKAKPIAVRVASPKKKKRKQRSLRQRLSTTVSLTSWQLTGVGRQTVKYYWRFPIVIRVLILACCSGCACLCSLIWQVVYAGNGLRGYGNLIILKHNSQYLSAYAYNSRLYVTEGEWVRRGQKIAAMGFSPGRHPALHFEIRKAGVPVNPLNLL